MSVYSHPVLRNDSDDISGSLHFEKPEIGNNEITIKNCKLETLNL